MSNKDALRAATVGKAPQLEESTVEYEGLTFYCRELPYKAKQDVQKRARIITTDDDGDVQVDFDQAEYELSLLVKCVFDGPRSDAESSQVFSSADRERIEQEGARKGGWLALLIDEVTDLNSAGNVEAKSEKSD